MFIFFLLLLLIIFLFLQNMHYRSGDRCLPCNCEIAGSTSLKCDVVTGQCPCVQGVDEADPVLGRRCDRCGDKRSEIIKNKGCVGKNSSRCPRVPITHSNVCGDGFQAHVQYNIISVFVVGWSSRLVQSWGGLLLVVTQVTQCLLIVQVGIVLRRTAVGCNPGESIFVVRWSSDWCSSEEDCCWLWPRWVNVCCWLIVRVGIVLRRTVVGCDPG